MHEWTRVGLSVGRGREDGICEICANLHMRSSVPPLIFPDAVCRLPFADADLLFPGGLPCPESPALASPAYNITLGMA